MVQPDFYIDEAEPHLGGFIRGGDDATYYPDLWRWFVEDLGLESVVDIGCGEGHAAKFFSELIHPGTAAVSVTGVDGVALPEDTELGDWTFALHDYTKGPWPYVHAFPMRVSLGWCCEFVEHIEERYVKNFVATFRCCDWVAMTHAYPGQPGWHHVNCRNPEYWVGVMAAAGLLLREDITEMAREKAALNTSPYNHFVRSGLVFERCR
jgi:hypothetical protein